MDETSEATHEVKGLGQVENDLMSSAAPLKFIKLALRVSGSAQDYFLAALRARA